MRLVVDKKSFISYLFIIDILFFPYIKPLKTSLSSILFLFLFLFYYKKCFNKKKYFLHYIFLLLIMFSFFISVFNYPNLLITNLSRFIIIFLMTMLFIFLSQLTNDIKINIKNIFLIYIFFNTILGIVYFVNSAEYFSLKNIWSLSTFYDNNVTVSIVNRFCGIVSDPNNCACLMISICAFLDIYNLSSSQKILKNIATVFIVFLTMSVSGLICLILYFGFNSIFILKKKIKLKIMLLNLFIILLIICMIIFILSSDIGRLVLERLEINNGTGGGGRIDKWINIFDKFDIYKYLIIGCGGTLIDNSQILNPHNGIIYIVFNYGLIAFGFFFLIFINPFIKIRKTNFFYLFFLINFILNTVIIDYRASLAYIIMFVFASQNKSKICIRKISKGELDV